MAFDMIGSGLVAVLCVDESVLVANLKFSEASGQIASSKGEIKDDKREDDVDDGKSHGRWLEWKNLQPLAGGFAVFSVDPDACDRQLRHQHHDGGGETDRRENRQNSVVGFGFLLLVGLFLFGGGDFWFWERGARRGGRFERNGGLWEYGNGASGFGCTSSGQTDGWRARSCGGGCWPKGDGRGGCAGSNWCACWTKRYGGRGGAGDDWRGCWPQRHGWGRGCWARCRSN